MLDQTPPQDWPFDLANQTGAFFAGQQPATVIMAMSMQIAAMFEGHPEALPPVFSVMLGAARLYQTQMKVMVRDVAEEVGHG